MSNNTNTNKQYTDEERLKILQYIIDNEAYQVLRGNSMWQKMQKKKKINRTWQSAKEHFQKKIIHNIHLYNIPKEEQKKILQGYQSTSTRNKTTDNKTVRIPSKANKSNMNFSDEEIHSSVERGKRPRSDSSSIAVTARPTGAKLFKKQTTVSQSVPRPSMDLCSETLDNQIENVLTEIENVENQPQPVESSQHSVVISVSDGTANDITPNVRVESHSSLSNCSDVSALVSSTNLDKTFIEFSFQEDEHFLKFITNDDDYLEYVDKSILYKSYAYLAANNRTWNELLDRFVDYIIPNLVLFDCAPKYITSLNNKKELIENFRNTEVPRLNSIISTIVTENINMVNQSTQISIGDLPLPVSKNICKHLGTIDLTTTPLNENRLNLLKNVQKKHDKLKVDFVNFLFDDDSSEFNFNEQMNEIQILLDEYSGDEETTSSSSDTTEPEQTSVKVEVLAKESQVQEVIDVDVVNSNKIQIKQENTQVNESPEKQTSDIQVEVQDCALIQIKTDDTRIEETEDCSESIHVQPDIYVNLSQFLDDSQYLNSLNTQEKAVVDVVEAVLENNNEEMEESFRTCYTQTQHD